MRIEYGDGRIHTQQGRIEGYRCLTITKCEQAHPINSTPKEWDKETTEDKVDVLLIFKNIESARTLQDELNELIALWSKEYTQPIGGGISGIMAHAAQQQLI